MIDKYLLLASMIALLMILPGGGLSETDYLGLGYSGRLDYPDYYNYTPAFAEFMARDYQPGSSSPVYLGRSIAKEPIKIGGSSPSFAELEGAYWYPIWPYNNSWTPVARVIPVSDPLSIEEYHVPSIVEFLSPDWSPQRGNYSAYVPAIGRFANASWTPPETNYSLHVPAIGAFLSEEWQSQEPIPNHYPQWIIWYLQS
jgi:hypothetical protein